MQICQSFRFVALSLSADVGVMSGCIIFIQKDLHIDEVQQEVLVGCLSFISLLGSLAAGRTSDTDRKSVV